MPIYLKLNAALDHYGFVRFFESHVTFIFLVLLTVVTACREQTTPTPTPLLTPTQAAVSFVTPTVQPTATTCVSDPRAGWELYQVQAGDTLSQLAEERHISTNRIMAANCLTSTTLIEGTSLYLPPLPTPTPCSVSPQPGWVPYTVRQGDTLYTLAAQRPGADAAVIAQANCLRLEDTLYVGNLLYLPPLPTPTPTATFTPTPTPLPPPMIPIQPLPTVVVFNSTPAAPVNPAQNPANPPGGISSANPILGPVEPPGDKVDPTLGFEPSLDAANVPIPNELNIRSLRNQNPCSAFKNSLKSTGLWPPEDRIQLGERLYLYGCNVTDPISATITYGEQGRTEEIPYQDRMPHLDRLEFEPEPLDRATYLTWPARPDVITMTPFTITIKLYYTPTASSVFQPNPLTKTLTVTKSDGPKILVVPTGRDSRTYLVYHINYTSNITHYFAHYVEISPTISMRLTNTTNIFPRKLKYVEAWPVTIPKDRIWYIHPITITGEWPNAAHAIVYGGAEPPNSAPAPENCDTLCKPLGSSDMDCPKDKITPQNPECHRQEWFFWPVYLNQEATP